MATVAYCFKLGFSVKTPAGEFHTTPVSSRTLEDVQASVKSIDKKLDGVVEEMTKLKKNVSDLELDVQNHFGTALLALINSEVLLRKANVCFLLVQCFFFFFIQLPNRLLPLRSNNFAEK